VPVKVRVRTIGLLKALFGLGELEVILPDGATVDALLGRLAETYGEPAAGHLTRPAEGTGHPSLRVMVNGRDIAVLDGRQTPLDEGDDVLILTPIAGG
jgi:molybdopterin converting factor small subunit